MIKTFRIRFNKLNQNLQPEIVTLDKNYLSMNAIRTGNTKILRCSAYPNGTMTVGKEYPVGTLPENMRPLYTTYQELIYGGNNVVRVSIQSTGAVTLTPISKNITTTEGMNINLAYI